MTKDRLAALQAAVDDADDEEELIEMCHHMTSNMKCFLIQVEEIRYTISQMQMNIEDIKRLHSIILSAPHSEKRCQEQLEQLMAYIRRNANLVRVKLQGIQYIIDQEEQQKEFSAILRVRKTQHAALSRNFVQLMTEYNCTQIKYRERCKYRIQRQLEIAGRAITNDQLEAMLEQGNLTDFTQVILLNTEQGKASLADIIARHDDIMRLEKSIKELHDMSMDMAILAESQGEMINRIEYQVELAKEHVQIGIQNTNRAMTYQDKARPKKICLLVTFIILITLVVGYSFC